MRTHHTRVPSDSGLGLKLLQQTAEWPDNWMRMDADLGTGHKILNAVLPFLRDLVGSHLAETTLRRHFGNVFYLGGEVIDGVNLDGHLRSLPGKALLLRFVDPEGGPLCRHLATEDQVRAYDSTCRRLFHYLMSLPAETHVTGPAVSRALVPPTPGQHPQRGSRRGGA